MVNNVTDKPYVPSVEGYNHAPDVNENTGKEKWDSNIPLQIWQERAGKAMNILQEKVRFRVDPAKGGVVMETGSHKDDVGTLTDGVIHPSSGAKGSLINRRV